MRMGAYSLIFVLGVCSAAVADQGRTEIGPTDTFPIVIDTPGSYVLTADLHLTNAGSGTTMIEVNADNVTLDLGGHVLRGPGADSNGTGVFGEGRTGVTVHNGTVTELGSGVVFFQDSGTGVNRFHDLGISHIGWGSGLGFSGGTAHNIVVVDVSAVQLVGEGVSCSACTLSNVTVRSSYIGIRITDGSATNCLAIDNELGFSLRNASLTGGAAIGNGGVGVRARYRSMVVGVTVSGNGTWGIELDSGGGSNAVNNTGGDNGTGNVNGCADGNGCHQNYLP
jgi:hypothetical protein